MKGVYMSSGDKKKEIQEKYREEVQVQQGRKGKKGIVKVKKRWGQYDDEDSYRISLPLLLTIVFLTGACLGIVAQLIRQILGPLMTLGASTAPWLTVGYFFATFVSKRVKTPRKAIVTGVVSIFVYLVTWLFFYHFLFIIRENLTIEDGLRQFLPWFILTFPISPILGTIAVMVHKRGIIGDMCLAVPLAWSMPEVLRGLKENWLDGFAIVIPMVVLAILLIRITILERQIHIVTLVTATLFLGLLLVVLYPIALTLFPY